MSHHRLAIFASGTGTNTINLYRYFRDHPLVEISLIVSDNPKAGILTNPEVGDVPRVIWDQKSDRRDREGVLGTLRDHGITFIVLAGYLKLIPAFLIEAYPKRILNIHPALLPKYGGKGMYGMNVHKAVLDNGDRQTGITIHYVNEKYDDGEIVFQARCGIEDCASPEEIAGKVHSLEYFHYPRIINQVLFSEGK